MLPHTSSGECPNQLDGYCKCKAPATTSTLDGKWPTDTWFQRAVARRKREEAAEIEAAIELSKV